jgi:hypothetical protein
MYKQATFKQKFAELKQWVPAIIEVVKKDLKNEHLKKDPFFAKKFFGTKNIQKITSEEMAEAYEKAIQEEEKGEDIAEFIASRWLFRNSEMYHFFEEQLGKLYTNFTELQEIEPQHADELIKSSNEEFSPPHTYLFSVLNSVVFPDAHFIRLKAEAEQFSKEKKKEEEQVEAAQSLEQMQRNHQLEVARLTDKYEKKLAGLQKKYVQDVESLKKQISALQRKLSPAGGR